MTEAEGVRLQKVLAQAGIASRRAAEQLIDEGRVEVNGNVVIEQGTRVDPERDTIRVDGSRIPPARRHVYLALNKPARVISTMDDPEGRADLSEFLPRNVPRLFHVGRLDGETTGLLLMTNDGDLAQRLSHPSYEIAKVYLAEVSGVMDNAAIKRLEKGVKLEDGFVRPDKVKLVSRSPHTERTMLEITLHSGANRVVRRLMDAIGFPVRKLSRIAFGPVRLGRLPLGETRELTREELGKLFDAAGM
ncbi:MFS transporter [Enemella dayhoffiae]|uniref:Pseudouridine synthase n=1 Tax=Enemella dayhoffiae TaxID=2016507 RepID=A0A255H370_9ACTN|nr:pseudouridine synthase [Enemella dayhoffiae]OYO22100.1 MFS transporter [Enemella dayhoffiae]